MINTLLTKIKARVSILLFIIAFLMIVMESITSSMYSLEFPNKKNKWFTLKRQQLILAELGTKNFDFYTNIEQETYTSFLVFSQGKICKEIFIQQNQADYTKFKKMPFIEQSLEIPTMNKKAKSFCAGKKESHFKLANLDQIRTVKKQFKRFNTDQDVSDHLKAFPNKKTAEDLKKEMITVDVLEMKLSTL